MENGGVKALDYRSDSNENEILREHGCLLNG